MKKIKIGLVFGGRSGEHEVSLISAWNIFHGFDRKKYEVFPIGIDKKGEWHIGLGESSWIQPENPKKVRLNVKLPKVTVVKKGNGVHLLDLATAKSITMVDVFFPITHGTYGEDGCLQGFFEICGAAYVGPGVLGSAVGMDKDVAKRLLRDAGFRVAKFHILRMGESLDTLPSIAKDLKFPIFVKPARQGSSVGISKALDIKELRKAVREAFKYDVKVILEEAIVGREIECSILGNKKPISSIPGEIVLSKGFYSYKAKYIDPDSAIPIVHADLPAGVAKNIRKLAIDVFGALECEGMSRVDFFLTKNDTIYVNEINTLPGFTNVSMYPKMLEETGIGYTKLLDKLVQFAIERKKQQDILMRDFDM